MGEAKTKLCPFKPLVEGSSPSALMKSTPKARGLFFLSCSTNGRHSIEGPHRGDDIRVLPLSSLL